MCHNCLFLGEIFSHKIRIFFSHCDIQSTQPLEKKAPAIWGFLSVLIYEPLNYSADPVQCTDTPHHPDAGSNVQVADEGTRVSLI